MWISKPAYESIPYFYVIAGVCSLAASVYLDYSFWPTLCFTVGIACLVAGLVVFLRRRDYRRSRKPGDEELMK